MSESRNLQVVREAYAAFGRRDIDGVLATLDESVQWQAIKGAEGVAPHAGLRSGRPAVREFFAQLASSLDFHRFEPREFVAEGDAVVVIGYYEATVKQTGGRIASDWVMAFTLRDGRITNFREWTDSAQIVRAYRVGAAA